MPAKISYLEELAGIFKGVILKSIGKTGKINLTEEPKLAAKDIIEYDHRLRVSGLEKFNAPAYVSAVSYYKTSKDKEEHNACGAVVLYIEEQFVEILLKALGHGGIDDEQEDLINTKCGEFCVSLAGDFKNEISSQGYGDLICSEPLTGRNSIVEGIDFSYSQYEKYEISFTLKGKRILVAEVTMEPGRK